MEVHKCCDGSAKCYYYWVVDKKIGYAIVEDWQTKRIRFYKLGSIKDWNEMEKKDKEYFSALFFEENSK